MKYVNVVNVDVRVVVVVSRLRMVMIVDGGGCCMVLCMAVWYTVCDGCGWKDVGMVGTR